MGGFYRPATLRRRTAGLPNLAGSLLRFVGLGNKALLFFSRFHGAIHEFPICDWIRVV